MKKFTRFFFLLIIPFTLHSQLQYPATKKVDWVDDYNGTKVSDPYRWLENDTSAETKAWVTEENKVTFNYLNQIPFRKDWQKRIEEVYNYPKYSAPFRNGEYYYFSKNDGLQNQSVLYRQKGLDGTAEVLIDPNKLSPDGTTALAGYSISRNGKYMAYGISKGGSDWQTFYVRDLATGKDLPDELMWVKVSAIGWQGDGFYYSRYPAPEKGKELSTKNENHQVYYHRTGTSQDQDQLIYEDKYNPQRFHIANTNEDQRFVYLNISDRGKGLQGNAIWYMDKQAGDKSFKPLIKEVTEYTYSIIDYFNGKFLVRTNKGAKNYRLILIDPKKPAESNWKVFLAEKPEPIQSVGTAGGKIFVNYLKDVNTRVYVYNQSGAMEKEVKLPELGTASGFDGWKDDKIIFYTFNSFNYPPTIFKYEISTGKTNVFRQPTIPSFSPTDYEIKQVFYPSKDGTKIPMFIVYKKGLKLNSSNPTILYAYGGFNINSLPGFSATLLPWLEQGGVYALANLRGGGEYGEKWHEAGMRLKKQNVFDDFIAAGEYLINNKYTSKNYLAIRGGSNGGLLIGAVINQRPDLFRVAIPQVGVMDMLRFHKFTIGWNWIAEYGSSDNPEDFKNLYAYSPLHNIKPGLPYPATLITTADHDDRVVPAHSFKYAATLQEMYKGNNPEIIRIETNSGHGASNTSKNIEVLSDIYSFIFYNMGLKPDFTNLNTTNQEKKKAF
jgi:prolyl oligopeptidase